MAGRFGAPLIPLSAADEKGFYETLLAVSRRRRCFDRLDRQRERRLGDRAPRRSGERDPKWQTCYAQRGRGARSRPGPKQPGVAARLRPSAYWVSGSAGRPERVFSTTSVWGNTVPSASWSARSRYSRAFTPSPSAAKVMPVW